MIPAFLIERFGPRAAKLIFWGVITLVVVVGGYLMVRYYFTAGLETQVKIGKGQTGAAITSGKEAVDTVGNRQAAEAAGATNVQEAQHAINNASDPGAVTDAGLAGLHRVRSGKAGSAQ